MKDVKDRFYLVLHPRPAYVIGSGKVSVKVNFMAASWVTPVSEESPRVAVAIDAESFTSELISQYGKYIVNVYPADKIDIVYTLGSASGRRVDKASRLNLKVKKGLVVGAPVLEDALAVIECQVWRTVSCGEVKLYIGDVVAAYADEAVFDRYGWNLRKVNIPLHNAGRGFYTVGRFIRANSLMEY